jgi:H+/Cl- antiporter ClcA
MAPLVLFGTLITHLLGGSAGREGTAVQMGGTIADQFTNVFKLDASEGKQFSFLASVLVLLPFWHSISGRLFF